MVFSTGCTKEVPVIETIEVKVPVVQKCPQPECVVEKDLNNVQILKVMLKCLSDREQALKMCK